MIDKEIYNLLYTDKSGEEVSLDEMQLLEDPPLDRVPQLIELLNNENVYISYQASLILSAWGIREGVEKIKEFVETKIDLTSEFEPHRIWGEDNVYDVMANALYIATISDYNKEEILLILKKILRLYGEKFFESKLKYALIDLNDSSLEIEIKGALNDAIQNKRYYQASHLLPVIAKYDKVYATNQIPIFEKLVSKDERIKYNIEETKEFLEKI